jgi:hypothetical protein
LCHIFFFLISQVKSSFQNLRCIHILMRLVFCIFKCYHYLLIFLCT